MKQWLLILLVLVAVSSQSCRKTDHHHFGPVVPVIEGISVLDIDPYYPEHTLFEGRPDIYVEVVIDGQIIAVTDVNQGAYIPFTTRSRDLPVGLFHEDNRSDVYFHIWDRDPDHDDFIGTLVWFWEDRYEGSEPHAANAELWDGFGNRIVLDIVYE